MGCRDPGLIPKVGFDMIALAPELALRGCPPASSLMSTRQSAMRSSFTFLTALISPWHIPRFWCHSVQIVSHRKVRMSFECLPWTHAWFPTLVWISIPYFFRQGWFFCFHYDKFLERHRVIVGCLFLSRSRAFSGGQSVEWKRGYID